jgi:hypothetical protein
VRENLLAGQKHALQVYVVDPVPTLLAGLDRAADFDDANIVVKYVDPAKCGNAVIDYDSDVIGTRYVPRDPLADATFRLDNSLGLKRCIEIDIGCEDLCSLAGEELAVALPLPHPGPLEPAPETSATFSLSRSTMLSSSGVEGSYPCMNDALL